MLARYVDIYDELLEVADKERAAVRMGKTEAFASQVERFCQILGEINVVAKDILMTDATLSDCRYAVNTLMNVVSRSVLDESTAFFECKLGTSV